MALVLNKYLGVFKGVKSVTRTTSIKAAGEGQILKRAVAFALVFIGVTSYTPNVTYSDSEFYSAEVLLPSTIITDDSGFLMPINPQTNQADRSGMTDKALHTVQSGETLSTIADSYGLKTATLLWENGLSETSVLKVGIILSIPPVDGVTHIVKSGQSLDKIAALYTVDKALISKQNALIDETIVAGQEIFVPGGKQLVTAPVYDTASYRSTTIARSESETRTALEGTTAAPAVGKILIYPTRGKISQGYRKGHLGIDIADRSMPPIWAASSGTVVKAVSGHSSRDGSGYGNYVIIDHGNGVKTLYGHLDYLKVSEGQYVNQGEVIGKMGNTGNVRGATGIHLHFEVIIDGVKMPPANYF